MVHPSDQLSPQFFYLDLEELVCHFNIPSTTHLEVDFIKTSVHGVSFPFRYFSFCWSFFSLLLSPLKYVHSQTPKISFCIFHLASKGCIIFLALSPSLLAGSTSNNSFSSINTNHKLTIYSWVIISILQLFHHYLILPFVL